MKDLINAKLFLKNNMSWCTAYNCSNTSKYNRDKTFILPKNECPRKPWIFGKNSLIVIICWLHFSFKMQFLRFFRRNNRRLFPGEPFFLVL